MNDARKIRFAPNGAIYLAPAPDGTAGSVTLPADLGDGKTPPAGYQSLGYVDESGVTITPSIETDPVNVWQSAVPVLYNVKSAAFQIKATLVETSSITTELFWGASWVAVLDNQGQETGVYRLDLASTPDLNEFSFVVDWSHRGILNRAVIPRAMVADRGAITLQRTEAQKYELTVDALDYTGNLGYILTNDSVKGSGNNAPTSQFSTSVTVPNSATNDAAANAWTARVTTLGQSGPASVYLLNAAGTSWSLVQALPADGQVNVTVPKGQATAEIKIVHAGASWCYSVSATIAAGSSKTCTITSG
ncbi:hypothetical protein [Kitasatospora cineracea]|uniref:phage tail tube protein n=1 Tax=Kitasatospora cineracea TaxID=88074 RepID=UPI0033F37CC2